MWCLWLLASEFYRTYVRTFTHTTGRTMAWNGPCMHPAIIQHALNFEVMSSSVKHVAMIMLATLYQNYACNLYVIIKWPLFPFYHNSVHYIFSSLQRSHTFSLAHLATACTHPVIITTCDGSFGHPCYSWWFTFAINSPTEMLMHITFVTHSHHQIKLLPPYVEQLQPSATCNKKQTSKRGQSNVEGHKCSMQFSSDCMQDKLVSKCLICACMH